jgi:DNA repair exonuclease SbcCD ATPase subunit
MSNQKQDYLFEDPIIPSQQWYCVSFFNKFSVKQSIDNNNDYKEEILKSTEKEDYSTENNVLGFKIRGGFATYDDAKNHAKQLSGLDPYHHIYVFEGGKWGAFIMKESDNRAYVEQTEYANDELNDMMKKYNENQDKAKIYHEMRKNQLVVNNLNENIKNREEVLSQTKDEFDNTKDKTQRETLKEKLASLDEQINKMLERKKELEDKEKEFSVKLDIGKLDL